jgi:hypothetical protein
MTESDSVKVEKIEPGDKYRFEGRWRSITAVTVGEYDTEFRMDGVVVPLSFDNGTDLMIYTRARQQEARDKLKKSLDDLVGEIKGLWSKPAGERS